MPPTVVRSPAFRRWGGWRIHLAATFVAFQTMATGCPRRPAGFLGPAEAGTTNPHADRFNGKPAPARENFPTRQQRGPLGTGAKAGNGASEARTNRSLPKDDPHPKTSRRRAVRPAFQTSFRIRRGAEISDDDAAGRGSRSGRAGQPTSPYRPPSGYHQSRRPPTASNDRKLAGVGSWHGLGSQGAGNVRGEQSCTLENRPIPGDFNPDGNRLVVDYHGTGACKSSADLRPGNLIEGRAPKLGKHTAAPDPDLS